LCIYRNNSGFFKNREELFKHIYSKEPEAGKYFFAPAESFDDFTVLTFSSRENLYFCWKLDEDSIFEYGDYPKGIHFKAVPIVVFRNVLQQWSYQLRVLG